MATVAHGESQYMHNGRIVLLSWYSNQTGSPDHYYADRVPCEIKLYKILTVLICIFSTPIALLCFIPTIRYLEKAQDEVENGHIEAARAVYRRSFCCRVLGWLWFALFISFLLSAIMVGTTLLAASQS